MVLYKLILLRRCCEIAFIVVFTFARNAYCTRTRASTRAYTFMLTSKYSNYLSISIRSVGFQCLCRWFVNAAYYFQKLFSSFRPPSFSFILPLFNTSAALPHPSHSPPPFSISFKSSTIIRGGERGYFPTCVPTTGICNLVSEVPLYRPQSADGTKKCWVIQPRWVSSVTNRLLDEYLPERFAFIRRRETGYMIFITLVP